MSRENIEKMQKPLQKGCLFDESLIVMNHLNEPIKYNRFPLSNTTKEFEKIRIFGYWIRQLRSKALDTIQ